MKDHFFVFDVESVGLFGEGFAVGYVVMNDNGTFVEQGLASCPMDNAMGRHEDRQWCVDHIPLLNQRMAEINWVSFVKPREVRSWFWSMWQPWRHTAYMAADCPWPVEMHFLASAIADAYAFRTDESPYPLIDVASVVLAKGGNPTETFDRHSGELPIHNPLCDARQSARILNHWRNT